MFFRAGPLMSTLHDHFFLELDPKNCGMKTRVEASHRPTVQYSNKWSKSALTDLNLGTHKS